MAKKQTDTANSEPSKPKKIATKKAAAKNATTSSTKKKETKTKKESSSPAVARDVSGRFVKGHMRIGGRKPGTPNKTSGDARLKLGETLLEELENLPTYLDEIDDPAKRVACIASLLPFYMPKYQSTTISADTHRSLSCEEQMAELDKQYSAKEIEITIKERRIINFEKDDD